MHFKVASVYGWRRKIVARKPKIMKLIQKFRNLVLQRWKYGVVSQLACVTLLDFPIIKGIESVKPAPPPPPTCALCSDEPSKNPKNNHCMPVHGCTQVPAVVGILWSQSGRRGTRREPARGAAGEPSLANHGTVFRRRRPTTSPPPPGPAASVAGFGATRPDRGPGGLGTRLRHHSRPQQQAGPSAIRPGPPGSRGGLV
jgi:hypothetical protein